VIYSLNTQNEDHGMALAALQAKHALELDEVSADAARKLGALAEALAARKVTANIDEVNDGSATTRAAAAALHARVRCVQCLGCAPRSLVAPVES
jgi:hypothetical protein